MQIVRTIKGHTRYKLPTYPVLINILPPPASVAIANRYQSEFRGLIARQDYHVSLLPAEARELSLPSSVRSFSVALQHNPSLILGSIQNMSRTSRLAYVLGFHQAKRGL